MAAPGQAVDGFTDAERQAANPDAQ